MPTRHTLRCAVIAVTLIILPLTDASGISNTGTRKKAEPEIAQRMVRACPPPAIG